MEVSVKRQFFFPEGSILSVKAGPVRRQAAVASGRPFKFPGRLENPIKVDVYQPIASGYVVARPGAQQYKVVWSNDTPLHCELEVSPSNGDKAVEVVGQTPRVDPEDSKQKTDASAQGAKEYLEQHQVLEFMQAVLQTVIKEKPEDPFKTMARHFLSGCNSTQELETLQVRQWEKDQVAMLQNLKAAPPLAPQIAVPPASVGKATAPLGLSPVGAPQPGAWSKASPALTASHPTLPPAPWNGALPPGVSTPPAAVPPGALPPWQPWHQYFPPGSASHPALPPQATGLLTKASPALTASHPNLPPGTQVAAGSKLPPGVVPPLIKAPLPPPPVGEPPPLPATSPAPSSVMDEDSAKNLKQALKTAIGSAVTSGDLQKALKSIKSKRQSSNSSLQLPSEQFSDDSKRIEQLRLATKARLENAVLSGELSQALEQTQSLKDSVQYLSKEDNVGAASAKRDSKAEDVPMQQMRRDIVDTLQRSYSSGDLLRALEKIRPKEALAETPVPELRQLLKNTLSRSVSSGELTRALERLNKSKAPKEKQNQAMKARLRGVLEKSCISGDLEQVLENLKSAPKSTGEDMQLRRTLKDTLQRSCASGDLERAMAKVKSKESNISGKESSEDLRQALKATLGRSVDSGQLETALSKVKGKCDMDEERRGLKDLLEKASVSGALERALESSQPQRSTTSGEDFDARNMLKETLERACVTGELKHAVGKIKESSLSGKDSGQDLREALKSTLSQSASSGDLGRALEKDRDSKSPKASAKPADMKQMMRETLERSCASGELKHAVGKIRASHLSGQESAQDLREALKNTLSQSASSGNLGRALERIRDSKLPNSPTDKSRDALAEDRKGIDMRRELGDKLQRSCTSGELQHALEIAKASMAPEVSVNEHAEKTRLLVKEALERSCSTGELDRAVDRVLGSNSPKKKAAGGDVEDMRQMLKDTLQRSCASGELDRAAKSIQESKVQNSEKELGTEDPRERMKAEMVRHAQTGELSSALGRIRAETRTDDTVQALGEADECRLRLKSLLQECQESGKLEGALRRVKSREETDADELRRGLKNSLLQGASSGKLREALDAVARSQHDEMRLALKNMLVEANENGELAKLMGHLTGEGRRLSDDDLKDAKELAITALSSALVGPQTPSDNEAEVFGAMRQRVKSLFQSAYEQGNLEEVLRSIAEGNPITDPAQARFEKERLLRGHVRELISTACVDGTLNEASEANSETGN